MEKEKIKIVREEIDKLLQAESKILYLLAYEEDQDNAKIAVESLIKISHLIMKLKEVISSLESPDESERKKSDIKEILKTLLDDRSFEFSDDPDTQEEEINTMFERCFNKIKEMLKNSKEKCK